MLLKDVAPAVGFGTSGVRALVSDLAPAVVCAYARAFARAIETQYPDVTGAVVGWDLRPSSPGIAAAVCAGLAAEGLGVEVAGACPTPAIGLRAIATARGGVVITGSHIPFDRNGVKFFTPRGEITKADEAAITSFDAAGLLMDETALAAALAEWTRASAQASSATLDAYRDRFARVFARDALAGQRIGVYQHSAVGRDFLAALLIDCGADVVTLARSESFVPIDTEAVMPEDEARAAAWCAQHRLDAIVSTDGDGDRPWVCDETGAFLRGDVLGIIAARRLGAERVATPVNSNTALEKCGAFRATVRTRIGSPYVIEAMEALAREPGGCIAGFEANGGFLTQTDTFVGGALLPALPTRDSTLPILLALTEARRRGAPLSELITTLPPRRTASGSIKGVPTARSGALVGRLGADREALARFMSFAGAAPAREDLTDGLRVELATGEIVHLRPSGNAPEFRCYTEADSQPRADALLRTALEAIAAHCGAPPAPPG